VLVILQGKSLVIVITRIIFCVLSLLSISYNSAVAINLDLIPCDKKAKIKTIFVNGMFNSRQEAEKSARLLCASVKAKELDTEIIKCDDVAYNENETILMQLLEVAKQKQEDFANHFWSYLGNIDSAPKEFKNTVLENKKLLSDITYANDDDLKKHIQKYKEAFDTGYNIILVAHSQGNFYSNMAVAILSEEKGRIKALSVATPASEVVDNGDYVTLMSDTLIRAIPGSLPANTDNLSDGLFEHEFIKYYLKGNLSSSKIINSIFNYINEFNNSDDNSTRVHSSLIDFEKWFKENIDSGKLKKLTMPQCIAVNLYLIAKGFTGESCDGRSLKSITEWTNFCSSKRWFDKDYYAYDTCILYNLPGIPNNLTGSNAQFEYLSRYPECNLNNADDIFKKMSPEIITEALVMLKKPK